MRRFALSHHLGTAWESLTTHRLRTFLTTLGVVVGIASITTVLALNDGVRHTIRQHINTLDGNVAVIRPATHNTDSLLQQEQLTSSSLTVDDYETVRSLDEVAVAAPMQVTYGTPKSGNESLPAIIVGTTPELIEAADLNVRYGQFLDSVTDKNTAVVGQQLAIDLFGSDRSIGESFTVRDTQFTVIGILREQNDPLNFHAVDFDSSILIHLSASEVLTGSQHLQQITLQATDSSTINDVQSSASQVITSNHKGEHDFRIVTGSDIAAPTGRLLELIQAMLLAVAIIALIVGGVGIMNISLVSVAERTREIGLRKAIGASGITIVWQFLIESLLICLFGAVIGLGLGYASAIAISTYLPFDPTFHWLTPAIALSTSIIIGVVFGTYPAIRAAQKDPIESLRHYD